MYPTVGVTRDKESLLLVLRWWCYKLLLEEEKRAAGGSFGELSWCRVRGGFYIIEAAFTCPC